MRLSIPTILVIAALGLSQQACGQDRKPTAPQRLVERDDSRVSAAASGGDCASDPAVVLASTVRRTLNAVSGNSPDIFLDMVSRDGIDFATDGAHVAFDALKTDFDGKTGRYCDLFACNGAAGPLQRLFKVGPMDTSLDLKNGRASIFVNANSNDELDLSFKHENCQWWLTGVGTP